MCVCGEREREGERETETERTRDRKHIFTRTVSLAKNLTTCLANKLLMSKYKITEHHLST